MTTKMIAQTTTSRSSKIEAGAALLGAGLGAVGVVMAEPLILVAGAVAAVVATGMRMSDHSDKRCLVGNTVSPRN